MTDFEALCPVLTCLAAPGHGCVNPDGSPCPTHAEREPATCPCQGEDEDPGPHIARASVARGAWWVPVKPEQLAGAPRPATAEDILPALRLAAWTVAHPPPAHDPVLVEMRVLDAVRDCGLLRSMLDLVD